MKMRTVLLLLLVTLASAMIFSVASPAAPRAKAAPAPAVQPAAAPAAEPAPVPPHPEIRDALDALRRAQVHLKEAKHDFGGHRADALRATDEAIHQLEICLKYD